MWNRVGGSSSGWLKGAVKFLVEDSKSPAFDRFEYGGEMIGYPPGDSFAESSCRNGFYCKRPSHAEPGQWEYCLIWPKLQGSEYTNDLRWDFKRENMLDFEFYRVKEAGQIKEYEEWGTEQYVPPPRTMC